MPSAPVITPVWEQPWHATDLLSKEASAQKLLLILTDGKPNDLDKYEGRYGIEDTRMAVLEAEKLGLRPFCVTIDEKAEPKIICLIYLAVAPMY